MKVFKSKDQNRDFYALMGEYFANLDIAKELERQVYNKPETTWLLDFQDGQLAAFVSVHETPKHYFIDNFYVISMFRGAGIGDYLIGKIVENFNDKLLKCIACNPAAIHIFKDNGFVEDGHNGKYTKLVKH